MNVIVPIIDTEADASCDAADEFTVRIPALNLSFRCRPDRHVLRAMQLSGLTALPVGCRSGGCGVCRIQVRAGSYAVVAMSRARISPSEEGTGLVLACRVFPRSDLEIEPRPLSTKGFGPQIEQEA